MNKRLIVITICTVMFLLAAIQLKHRWSSEQTFGESEIRYGTQGGDVYELQGRLKLLGFYKGDVDGDFGYETLQSLKTFQQQFGMKVDGIAGGKTKVKLWEATKEWSPDRTPRKGAESEAPAPPAGSPAPGSNEAAGQENAPAKEASGNELYSGSNNLGLSDQDMKLMANAVFGESRGEPYVGQIAVAAVILNRVKSASFPNTVSGVIFQPGAFTAVADGQIWLTPNDVASKAVKDALNGYDPTGGCTYYFNPETATSAWIWSRPQVKQIGKHIFCK
ncbi:spore cortex-lytic enzyme [Paenibacillus ginsengarvi]|uniref:Spore cortex-lytic enzyme n=1 Tax=Paenibacillus ginsengarvi TaxID=400777 RepID=A0A3B0CNM5_9BACL|nr:spore cortex-lytic enzyme [Paenibacillus ginsengarvi]RKN86461.1 spore cortex-lytic enzyme [Paenibacillus ginsengarvi]